MNRIMYILILAFVLFFKGSDNQGRALAEMKDSIMNSWADKEEKHIYRFLNNNEFQFSVKQKRLAQEDDLEYDPRGPAKMINEKKRVEGVYRLGHDVCWIGTQKGNLIIFVDELQCCFDAGLLGGKLVLSEIWVRPSTPFSDMLGICENRVLSRMKK